MAQRPLTLNIADFVEPSTGRPVALGFVYVGNQDLDPEILANRKTVTLVEESGNEVTILPAAQPLALTAGGVIQYNGSPVVVLVDDVYSIKVTDSLGAQVYYVPRANEYLDTFDLTGFLVENGSFEVESAGVPAAWTLTPTATGTIATDSTDVNHGLQSLKFTSVDALGAGNAETPKFPCSPGGTLYVAFDYKSTLANTATIVSIDWFNTAGALQGTTTVLNNTTTNPAAWTRFTTIATPPGNAATGQLKLIGMDPSGATTIGSTWFDDVLVWNAYDFTFNSATQTLENKTIVSPTVTGGTFTDPVLVDPMGVTGSVAPVALAGGSTLVTLIPAAKNIIIHIAGMTVSNAAITLDLQIGDSGGIEVSGYSANSNKSSSLSSFSVPSAYRLDGSASNDATTVWDGTIRLYNVTGSVWHIVSNINVTNTGFGILETVGTKALTAQLDRYQISVSAGTFTAGTLYTDYHD